VARSRVLQAPTVAASGRRPITMTITAMTTTQEAGRLQGVGEDDRCTTLLVTRPVDPGMDAWRRTVLLRAHRRNLIYPLLETTPGFPASVIVCGAAWTVLYWSRCGHSPGRCQWLVLQCRLRRQGLPGGQLSGCGVVLSRVR
jgi:hypothetical protein